MEAVAHMRLAMREAATAQPASLAALAKDVAGLAKLLRNPATQPDEPKTSATRRQGFPGFLVAPGP